MGYNLLFLCNDRISCLTSWFCKGRLLEKVYDHQLL